MPKTRLYVNITNHCNVSCPFCCMYSSPGKQTFMAYDKFMEENKAKYGPSVESLKIYSGFSEVLVNVFQTQYYDLKGQPK